MAQNIAFFLFSRKLLQDAEKKEAKASEIDEKPFQDIPLSDDDDLENGVKKPANGDAATNGDGAKKPKFSIRLPSSKEEKKPSKRTKPSSRRWELVLWAAVLAVFAALTLWHWLAIIINYSSEPSPVVLSESTLVSRSEWVTPASLPFPNPTLCFPLYLDYIPFTVLTLDPYIPRIFDWNGTLATLNIVLPRISLETFYDTAWSTTSNGRAFILTSAALLARLTEVEEPGSGVRPESVREAGREKAVPIPWFDRELQVTSDINIKLGLKAASVKVLWNFLKKHKASRKLHDLRAKLSNELCRALRLEATFLEEIDYNNHIKGGINCSSIHLSWISRQATCFKLDVSSFESQGPRQQVEVGLDLNYLYGEFVAYMDHYERNFTWGGSGRAWYTQATTLSVDGPKRQLSYYGADVCTAGPGLMSKHLLEISEDYEGDPAVDDCSAGSQSLEDCRDRCHAKALEAACGERCVPFVWEEVLGKSASDALKHCSLADYSACLRSRDGGAGAECLSACREPCRVRRHRLTPVSQGPVPVDETRPIPGRSLIRLTYGTLRHQRLRTAQAHFRHTVAQERFLGPHELIALLGGAANFWLGLSVAGLFHLIWFLAYELPRIKRLERKQEEAEKKASERDAADDLDKD